MGNTATKEYVVGLQPPAVVTTTTTTTPCEITNEKELPNDEDLTIQTEGTGSVLRVVDSRRSHEEDCCVDDGINMNESQSKDNNNNNVTMVTVDTEQISDEEDFDSVVSCITLHDSSLLGITQANTSSFVRWWDGKKFFSDYVREGVSTIDQIEQTTTTTTNTICMVFENPSTSPHDASFFNGNTFKFHEFPPSPPLYKAVLTPCRYSMMNGNIYPTYLQGGIPPAGLMDHWKTTIPGFIEPVFVPEIPSQGKVYAYLPMESIANYVNDPHVHYHLCGKDAIHLMTKRTPKLLANTQDQRPCICKTTHSMAGKGIFIIRNDDDEREFQTFIEETGNPTFVVTEFINIERNVACHFFIHPNGEGITWFGCNENRKLNDGSGGWSPDSTIIKSDQEHLKEIQLPFVMDVVRYFQSLGFWGFCGVDVLFDTTGKGYLVDVNPRVTGSLPAIMVGHLLYEVYKYEYCLFRRSARYAYRGTADAFLHDVQEYNKHNKGNSIIVVNSFAQETKSRTLVQLGVYCNSGLDECQAVLDHFAPSNASWNGED